MEYNENSINYLIWNTVQGGWIHTPHRFECDGYLQD